MSKSIKKLFVFFGIFAACLIFCLCALSACDDAVQTAEAFTSIRVTDGVVRPNVFSTYFFDSVSYNTSSLTPGIYGYDSSGSYDYDTFVYSSNFSTTSNNAYVFKFVMPISSAGYYYPCLSVSNIYINVGSSSSFSLLLTDVSDNDLAIETIFDGTARTDFILKPNDSTFNSRCYVAANTTLIYYLKVFSSVRSTFNGTIDVKFFKVENPPDYVTYQYNFSGFAIPGITYQDNGGGVTPDPVPGYWDDWDGVVRPNRLRNSSEFVDGTGWVLPSDAVIDEQLITVSSSTDPVLIKNRTSRSYEPNQGESLTLSCYLTDISGSAKLMLTGTGGTLLSDTNDLVEGLNYVTFELDTLGGVEVTPEFAIYLSADSSVSIDWVKMERGGLFTGYVVNVDELYDQAYSQGYLDGSQAYAFRSSEINYDNVETNVESIGWADFGIEDDAQLVGAFWSMTSSWFEDQGYNITSSGRFIIHQDVTQNGVTTTNYGIVLYVSVAEVTALTDLTSPSYPTVYITMMEHQSSFHVYDSAFPDPWNPVQYPDARKVRINVQLGVQEWLDSVSSAADKLGYQRGLDEGYANGRESGYRDGFNYGYEQTQNGTWRGMISALIGVPVTYLVSLFNFEILGFNFLSVFKTIVVISLFLFIVKALLGKVEA